MTRCSLGSLSAVLYDLVHPGLYAFGVPEAKKHQTSSPPSSSSSSSSYHPQQPRDRARRQHVERNGSRRLVFLCALCVVHALTLGVRLCHDTLNTEVCFFDRKWSPANRQAPSCTWLNQSGAGGAWRFALAIRRKIDTFTIRHYTPNAIWTDHLL